MRECKGPLCEVQHRNINCGAKKHAERMRDKAILEASTRVNQAKNALDGALIDLQTLLEARKP